MIRLSLPNGEYLAIPDLRKLTDTSIATICVVVKVSTIAHSITNESRLPGSEHQATTTNPAKPSYCTEPMFHPSPVGIMELLGYISNDGHVFSCRNPVVMRQAFHVYVFGWLVYQTLTSLTKY
jgi:hypothetical protein